MVRNLKTITLYGRALNTNTFSVNISSLSFTPTHCNIKQISIYDNNYVNSPTLIICNSSLFGNQTIFSYATSQIINSFNMDLKYKISGNINGNYTFTFNDIFNTPPSNYLTFDTTMGITLEFIEKI